MLGSRVGVHLRSLSSKNAARSVAVAASQDAGRSALVRVPKASLTRLGNGLSVASEDWDTRTCTVGVWLRGGSRSESDAVSGASQLLRQLAFSGGSRRSAKEIRAQVEERGASVGASVEREASAFTVTCFSADLPWAVELLADVVRDTSFEEQRLERRRAAALAELRAAEADLQTVVMDYLHAAAYQGTGMSLSPLGQTESLGSLDAVQLRRFAEGRLRPGRMLVAAAGGVGHTELADLCQRHFGDLADAGGEAAATESGAVRFTGSSLLDRDDQLPYAHVAIAVEGPPAASVDTVPLLVASAYIGGWDRSQGGGNSVASRLARQARDAFNGGVVSYRSFFDAYSDTSLWGMHFVANQESVNYFSKDFQTDWMELTQDVRDFDVARAKNALLTWLYTQVDGTEAACSQLARSVRLYDRRLPLPELEERLAAVTAADVSRVAAEFLYDRCPAVAAVGPIEGLPDYSRVRGKMWFYRV